MFSRHASSSVFRVPACAWFSFPINNACLCRWSASSNHTVTFDSRWSTFCFGVTFVFTSVVRLWLSSVCMYLWEHNRQNRSSSRPSMPRLSLANHEQVRLSVTEREQVQCVCMSVFVFVFVLLSILVTCTRARVDSDLEDSLLDAQLYLFCVIWLQAITPVSRAKKNSPLPSGFNALGSTEERELSSVTVSQQPEGVEAAQLNSQLCEHPTPSLSPFSSCCAWRAKSKATRRCMNEPANQTQIQEIEMQNYSQKGALVTHPDAEVKSSMHRAGSVGLL